MAHTHEHDCVICGAHFDSSEDLDRHNEQSHHKEASGAPDLKDRNPRQGFQDPRADRSDAT